MARWEAGGDFIAYRLDGLDPDAQQVMLDEPNALYAFVLGEDEPADRETDSERPA
ncbi:hypothetical protein [Chelativorans sp.]|uniref:hypothetical protein n=1 Tax=Chelativorans sp. TaxID=2203393 RepID=UPI002810E0CB|nr:hypothetical protein [Chelativorans sp.]